MTRTSKDKVIRVGDRVKVITSKFVKRVGYPLIWTDIIDEVRKDPRTLKAWEIICAPNVDNVRHVDRSAIDPDWLRLYDDPADDIPLQFIRICAQMRVEERNYGGDERAIIYKKTVPEKAGLFWSSDDDSECADYTNQVFIVNAKKVVKTGTRYAPTGGVDHDGEHWGENGGLDDVKTHVLLQTNAGWIEAVNVEKL